MSKVTDTNHTTYGTNHPQLKRYTCDTHMCHAWSNPQTCVYFKEHTHVHTHTQYYTCAYVCMATVAIANF